MLEICSRFTLGFSLVIGKVNPQAALQCDLCWYPCCFMKFALAHAPILSCFFKGGSGYGKCLGHGCAAKSQIVGRFPDLEKNPCSAAHPKHSLRICLLLVQSPERLKI